MGCLRDRQGRSALDRATDPELVKLLASASTNPTTSPAVVAEPEVDLDQQEFVSCSVEQRQHHAQQTQAMQQLDYMQRLGYMQRSQHLHRCEQQLQQPVARLRP